MLKFPGVEEAVREIRRGHMIIVRDSLDRENEADLVMAAEKATPAAINFMIKHGGGLICVAFKRERAAKLGLSPMVSTDENTTAFGCDFTVSVDARKGVTTGISAADRARTVGAATARHAKPEDIVQPVEEPLVQRVVEGSGDVRAGFQPAEQRCHRGEAHHRRAGGRERAEGVGEHRRSHQVDAEDAAPVSHGGRDARCVRHRAQRAQFPDPGGQPGEPGPVGDVQDHRLGRRSPAGCRGLLGRRGDPRPFPLRPPPPKRLPSICWCPGWWSKTAS